jgi:DNA-binding SARP family transcriptional activator/tetratricopeptide (TPR) repeat protein
VVSAGTGVNGAATSSPTTVFNRPEQPPGRIAMQFRVLGAVEARVGGRAVDLGPARRRCVLAALLLEANHVVPVEQLLDRVWEGDSARRGTLYSHVSRLRTALAAAEGVELTRRSGGYLLTVDPMDVDLHRFRHLVGAAHRATDPGQAAAHYRSALELWRGEAFAGLDTQWISRMRTSLDLERRAAELDWNDLMLRQGRHADVLTGIAARSAEHPLDERLAGQLMLALHQAGRRPEALQVYQDTRSALVDELGLEPGPELHDLHHRILVGGVAARVRRAEPDAAPRQLPADISHFTGRDRYMSELRACVARSRSGDAPAVAAIAGTAGVGKTALAVHFGHEVADRFPDGQLYLDLRGNGTAPEVTAAEALGHLLRGLGRPPEQIPTDVQELAATYRSHLAGRRVLVVLDNARTAEQVGPLLPGAPGCLVVVTSRTILSALDNAEHIHVDVLSEQEALALLATLVGRDRADADPGAAAAVVRMCARLPLAIRLAGARLAARPRWSVATLAELLADEERRLEELAVGDRAVRTGFEVSHRALLTSTDQVDREAARAFRRLGALDWVDMSVPVACALLDTDPHGARSALERLVDDQLLESAAPGRYHTHDLLRLYARELAQQDSERDRAEALERVLRCYVDAAERANLLVNPMSRHRPGRGFPLRGRFPLATPADAGAWAATEHDNLVAALAMGFDAPGDAPALAVRLSAALNRPFDLLGRWQGFVAVRGQAAETAQHLEDWTGAAFAWQDVAWTQVRLGRADDAIATTKRALDVWREVGDRRNEQACLNILGYAFRQLGRHTEAVEALERAHGICRDIGHRYGEAATLNHLGLVHKHLRRFDDAVACHTAALALNRELDDRSGQAVALANLGWAHHRAGTSEDAVECFRRSLALAREAGDRYQEAETLWGLGDAHHALGNLDEARAYWNGSITVLGDIGAIDDEQAVLLRRLPVPDPPAIILDNT